MTSSSLAPARRAVSLCALAFGLSACGDMMGGQKAPAPEAAPTPMFTRGAAEPLDMHDAAYTGLAYAAEAPSADARIFLVAGSLRGANFAQEVVEQRQLWLARGAAESEIACYYVIPDKKSFDDDEAQYRALASELGTCRLASFGAITADLALAATTAPESIYVYVTSHGDRPLSVYAAGEEDAEKRAKLEWLVSRYPVLDRYMLALDATPTGSAGFGQQLDAIDAGVAPDEIFLTPRALNAALAAFAPETRKTAVLQGCFSGGFLTGAEGTTPEDTLAATPALTALTAARNDRPSFGCGLAAKTTYFGGAVLEALRATDAAALPADIDWKALYETVREKVQALEAAEGFRPSEPQYFSNR